MAKGNEAKGNGTLRTVRIAGIILGIVLATCGVIWGFATQSGNLDRAVIDVAKVEIKSDAVAVRVGTVEKAMIKIETDISYIKRDVGKILKKVEAE